MESIEAMRARFDAQIEKASREHAIAAACPVMPKRVQINSSGMPTWLSYETDSLADALALLSRLGDVVPFYGYKSTFTRYQPESLAKEKDGAVASGPHALSIDVSQGAGYGPTAKLKAFVAVGSEVMQAHIQIGGGYIGTCPQFAATYTYRNEARGGWHREQRVIDWRPNSTLNAENDTHTKWATGSNDSAHYEYLWSSDDVEGGSDHATAALWRIVEQSRSASFRVTSGLESFLSTMLEDMQISENEEACTEEREAIDVGTIYTVPEETFRKASAIVRRFYDAFEKDIDALSVANREDDRVGADLYLVAAGHGAGFADRVWDADDAKESKRLAEVFTAAVPCRIETYVGDDGRAYISGGL